MSRTMTRSVLPWAAIVVASLALGAGIAVNLQVAFILVVTLVGLASLAAPAGAWVLCALVAAVTFRGFVQLGVMPSVATFLDLPLAWGALMVGLLKRRGDLRLLGAHLRWLLLLVLAIVLAWAFHRSEALRPIAYLALLGEPFAVIGALIADPPSPRLRVALERTMIALLLVQIPLAALQLVTLGPADHVQGTLYGAGAGAHVISGVIVVGALWILARGSGRGLTGAARVPIVLALLVIPFVADAKQVILAMPALLLASVSGGGRLLSAARGVIVVASVVALFALGAGAATENFLNKSGEGQGGKEATAEFVWKQLRDDPASMTFGKGPAETVSRAAFMTTGLFQRGDSPLATLGLQPATLAIEAQGTALAASGGGSSFNGSTSSALGVLGDLGIFGLLVYVGLLASLFVRLRRVRSPEGIAAAGGVVMFLVLGLFFDWWEQPPFGVFIGTLAGLAFTAPDAVADESAQPASTARLVAARVPSPFVAATDTRR